ncbi:hypothetical protein [Rhodomicrobium sp.]|uniref:hypothetical protein n=1 Tax=Rhodomicrobium sp. TaxID=2720632 RepID=UPI0039E6B097
MKLTKVKYMHSPDTHRSFRAEQYNELALRILRAPQFLIEKYSLTFFAASWLLPTLIHIHITLVIILLSFAADIGINRQNDHRVMRIQPMHSIIFVAISLIVLFIWKSYIDAHKYVFAIEPIKKLYELIDKHELLISSATITEHPCIQWGGIELTEKLLLHISLVFVGLALLRWVKLRLYEIFRGKSFYQVSYLRFWPIEFIITMSSYLFLGFIVYVIYCSYNKYCQFSGKTIPVIMLCMTILFAITVYSINVTKIFRAQGRRR